MRSLVTILLLFLVNCCFAQNLAGRQSALLWAIVNAKGDTSYLFGTFHEFGSSYYKKYPEVWNSFKKCSALYLEQLPNTLSKENSSPAPVNSVSWIDALSSKDRKAIDKYLKNLDFDVPLNKLKGISPFDLKYEIMQDLNTKACRIEDERDEALMEEYLFYLAPKYKISVSGLEYATDSLVVQTTKFVSGSEQESDAVAFILHVARNEQKYIDSVRLSGVCREVDAYGNGRTENDLELVSTSVEPMYAVALDQRNYSWLPAIRRSVDVERTFIAVGMMHLRYKNGLVNLLMNEGYKVLPVAIKPQ